MKPSESDKHDDRFTAVDCSENRCHSVKLELLGKKGTSWTFLCRTSLVVQYIRMYNTLGRCVWIRHICTYAIFVHTPYMYAVYVRSICAVYAQYIALTTSFGPALVGIYTSSLRHRDFLLRFNLLRVYWEEHVT